MKKIISVIAMTSMLFAFYCSSDDATTTAVASEIDGSWSETCGSSQGKGEIKTYSISNLTVTETAKTYETSGCDGTTQYTIVTKYTFVLDAATTATTLPSSSTSVTPKKIDSTLVSTKITANTATGVTSLGAFSISDVTWTVGTEVDVTGKTYSQGTLKAAGSKYYSIYIVHTDGKLYTGRLMEISPSTNSPTGESEAERKTSLDKTLTKS